MRTYPVQEGENRITIAFEVKCSYISIGAIASLLNSVKGISDLRVRQLFERSNGIHVWFRYREKDCVVYEPFGDSDRYFIGQRDSDEPTDLSEIEHVFQEYRTPLLRRVREKIFTLGFGRD